MIVISWIVHTPLPPKKIYVHPEPVNFSYLDMWPYWEKVKVVEMRSSWIRVGPISMTSVLVRKVKRRRHRREGHLKEAETGGRLSQTNKHVETPEAGTGMELIFPQSLQKEPTALAPWFWISGLKKCEINFCCFQSSSFL